MSKLHLRILEVNIGSQTFSPSTKIRVNTTIYPNHKKDAIILPFKNISRMNHTWTFDTNTNSILPAIDKIRISIREKNFFEGDPILGKIMISLNNDGTESTNIDEFGDLTLESEMGDNMMKRCGFVHYQLFNNSVQIPPKNIQYRNNAIQNYNNSNYTNYT